MPWTITYATITPESAEIGEYADSGIWAENLTLGEAMRQLDCRGAYCEADSCPISSDFPPRWFTFPELETDPRTGTRTNYSLHIPDHITPASRMRLARFLACCGIQETRQ